MKQILLALILIAVPVAAFTGFEKYLAPQQAEAATASLGDLSALKAIVSDTTTVAKTGDLVAAEKKITDFESAWDDGEEKLRPLDENAWGVIDSAADKAIHALRADTPDAVKVEETLASLSAAIDNPMADKGAAGTLAKVAGIAVTDANGHAIPCETMLTSLRDMIKNGKIVAANQSAADGFVTKATERCNADDDVHADEFSAQGLALATN
jgi:hypothetical protein